jgi:hypothetical protein
MNIMPDNQVVSWTLSNLTRSVTAAVPLGYPLIYVTKAAMASQTGPKMRTTAVADGSPVADCCNSFSANASYEASMANYTVILMTGVTFNDSINNGSKRLLNMIERSVSLEDPALKLNVTSNLTVRYSTTGKATDVSAMVSSPGECPTGQVGLDIKHS